MIQRFIIVDDDPINNIFCQTIIEMVFPEAEIQTYTDPETALAFIKSTYTSINAPETVLLLDINMPALTGWEFLDTFEQFDSVARDKIKVYMLSSSIDTRDKERASGNKNVLGYLEKPLTVENVNQLGNK